MRASRRGVPGRAGEAGFTLLELLIATTVLAFLSLLLFGGLQFGTRVWEKTETSTSAMNRVRAAQQILSDELMRVYPFFVSSTVDNYVDFDGQEQHVTFLAPSNDFHGAMDRVTIASVPGRDGMSVVMSTSPELAAVPSGRRRTIIGGLKWFQISYFGPPTAAPHTATSATALTARAAAPAATQSAPPQWTSVWKGQARLPMLIRIRASLTNKSQWPDLVITPRVDVDEGCVFDEVTKYCQGR
jgi:general secretion pathway protein J